MHTMTAKLLHILQISLQSTYIQWNQSHDYITHVKKVRQYMYHEQLSTLIMTQQAENVLKQCNYHISYTHYFQFIRVQFVKKLRPSYIL